MAESVNIEAGMAIRSEAVTETAVVERRSVPRWGGGPLARAVARAPVSVRTKLLVGFGVMVLLLVVVAATGLLALRQSKSRAQQLRIEQQKASLTTAMLAEASVLQDLLKSRVGFTVAPGTKGVKAESPTYYETLDNAIGSAGGDLGGTALTGAREYAPPVYQAGKEPIPRTDLQRLYPAFAKETQQKLNAMARAGTSLAAFDQAGRGLFAEQPVHQLVVQADWFAAALESRSKTAQARTNQLVAEDTTSFASSRNLLLGISGGSLALALALGLLISWSLVVPLRKTGTRMAEIAAGDFTGNLEVPNRDEIGTLATNVNQMSDELGRLYQELETASRHKSDFLATMSHELRTPLNAIIGFSEVLEQQMFGELNERQLGYVEDIVAAGRHLLSLINDVLDLAKIEAGRMELDLTEVRVHDLLSSATSMNAERAARGGLSVELSVDPEEITILADERRVRQIVFNLLSNAIKFTPADGRINVSARLDEDVVEFAIADTGPGIPASDQQSIFREFEQSESSRDVEGTGLGLPLSRKLVELHGGRLWVESEVGHGSTFRFTLPLEHEG